MFERLVKKMAKALKPLAIPAGLEPATTRLEGGAFRNVNKVNSDIWGMNASRTSGQSLNSKSGQISPRDKWRRRPRWIWLYVGPCDYADFPLSVSLALMIRRDLMGRGDEGMMVPVAFGFDLLLGPSYEAMQDGVGHDIQRWRFRPRFRCDASEIARRLAGGDE